MPALQITEQEKVRAQAYADALRDLLTLGAAGADPFAPLQTPAEWGGLELEAQLRRAAYATLRSLAGPNLTAEPTAFANNWAHLGGSFNTTILCYVDALGLKHIEGACQRTTGSAVNGEIMFYLPEWMAPAQDGKILLCATSNGVGRVDLFEGAMRFRTTGGYTGGSAYVSFDNVPPYR